MTRFDQDQGGEGQVIVQRPSCAAEQLVLLFHGAGGGPQDMVPLGRRIAGEFPHACIVSIAAPQAAGAKGRRQWYPIDGVTDASRAERVDAAMPGFLAAVRHWQAESGVGREGTALIGFSQGAIMALESTREREALAGRVVSIGGRFARLPERARRDITLHLLHGKADEVIPYAHTIRAAERIVALGGDITADVLPFVGHVISEPIEALLIERLKTHVPQRCWDEALRSDPGPAPAARSCH